MTTIVMVSMWIATITGWSTAIYLFVGAQNQNPPKSVIIIRLIAIGIIALVVGCVTLAAMNTIGAYHSAFKF